MTPPSTHLEFAMAYCAQGWSVFPQLPRSKVPATDLLPFRLDKDGCQIWNPKGYWERTIKPFWERQPTVEELHLWFDRTRPCNIALTCGRLSGICVVEFDDWDCFSEFRVAGGFPLRRNAMPDTPTVLSRRGAHIYFAMPQHDDLSRLEKCDFATPLEVKGEGRNITAPPSEHAKRSMHGEQHNRQGHIYSWATPYDAPVAPLPDWFLERVALFRTQNPTERAPPSIHIQTGSNYLQAALQGERVNILQAGDGKRHDVIRNAAWKLTKKFVLSGQLGRDDLLNTLVGAAEEAGVQRPGVRSFINRTIQRAMD